MNKEILAIHGGSKVKTTPFTRGKRFGLDEAKELLDTLEQNTLFYHKGKKVKSFLNDFNELYAVKHSVAVSSGTAAVHVALGTAGLSVGDEVITSPITDMGTLIGILYQNAVPVFADLDPHSYNMIPQSIESRITPRTKAILVVHLAGNPCDMDAIMDIAKRNRLKVIEDCAQSYLTRYKGQLVGTIGDYGCFSSNDSKHISTGDGGVVTINSGDEADYYAAHAFADKNYRRFETIRELDFLAPNYRMTELQGAVGIAQLKKLPWICEQRHQHGERITAGICNLQGITPHKVEKGNWSSYWFYMFTVDSSKLSCTRDQFSQALKAEGIPNTPGYIQRVVYMHPLFQNRQAYRNSHFPFELSDVDYSEGVCPQAEAILRNTIRLPINEFYSKQDIDECIQGIRKVALFYAK